MVRLRLRGQERRGHAEAVTDAGEILSYVDAFLKRNGLETARRIGLRVEGEERPFDQELVAALEGTVAVVVDVEPPDRPA